MRAGRRPRLCIGTALWIGEGAGLSVQGPTAEPLRIPIAAAGLEGLDALKVTPGTSGRMGGSIRTLWRTAFQIYGEAAMLKRSQSAHRCLRVADRPDQQG